MFLQVVILVLAGKPADNVNVGVESLKSFGVKISVLGAGYNDKTVLLSIASSPAMVQIFTRFRQILQFVPTMHYRYELVTGMRKPGEPGYREIMV